MRTLDVILNNIAELIDTYESGQWQSADKLLNMLRQLTANNYYLTKYNIEAYQKANGIKYMHKGSVASGNILADEQVPELRMTRKILSATEHVIWSMRSELSIIKKEQ